MLRQLLAVAAVVFVAIFPMRAQSTGGDKQVKSSSLKLEVRTDRRAYRMSETILLETQLSNVGASDVYVWNWDLCRNPARGFSMYIKAKDGRPVQSQVLLDCLPPPPKPDTPYQFIKITPRKFHGTIDSFKVKDFINKPGEYYIEVTFNSFLSGDFMQEAFANDPIAKLPLWTMEKPTVTAPPVHIVVNH
jgi:hypothetical protein